MDGQKNTKFASPERLSREEVLAETEKFSNKELFEQTINAFPEIVLFINDCRQIVFCNSMCLRFLGQDDISDILGKRPGEVFNCLHSDIEESGCGTSEFCMECGAVNAILSAQNGVENVQECRMTMRAAKGETALDLRVWATPIRLDGKKFTVFIIEDVSDEKRRHALERVFFHDVLNEASLLKGYIEMARKGRIDKNEDITDKMHMFTMRMIDVIEGQRDLVYAEKDAYIMKKKEVRVQEILNEIVLFCGKGSLGSKKLINVECDGEARINTDKTLLRRVLLNLLKNALESAGVNETVTIGCSIGSGKDIVFHIHNATVMPPEIRHQLFQRSFSTKGPGRGIGTYSARLFAERYLDGKIWYESSKDRGTTFFVSIPKRTE
ncbi:MAG: ATP-binding protein [Candidatus Omnitrophica bacterium]|nr:ATP-binding protein [Candidatus Omnitrophota bacterium]MDD5487835.1 ATP-binding protein [Candidatus Omnitrophota bacterium]